MNAYRGANVAGVTNTTLLFKITENLSFPLKTYELSQVSPVDYVVVKFDGKYSYGGKEFESGITYVMPALLVYAIVHDMKEKAHAATVKYTLYGVLVTVGVGEILAASTTIEMTVALVDMAIASNDIIINEVLAKKLNKTAEGKLFLDYWNKFALLYGGTRVYTELSGLSTELKGLAKKINKPESDEIVEAINRKVAELEAEAIVSGTGRVFRNISYEDFIKTFSASEVQYQKAFQLWGEEKWDELYGYFKTNNVNGGWPPFNGAKSIIKIENGNQLEGKIFDRFQGPGEINGSYASPVYGNEDVGDLFFTYDSRALGSNIKESTNYIKFKFKKDIPDDISFEYCDIIPWFGKQGLGDQIKSSKPFNDIQDYIEIVEQLEFKNGQWEKIK
jgi:hypothetical protein